MGRFVRHLAHRLNPVTIVREACNYAANRVIPQGAAEVAQALNSQSNAYVPYGHAQAAVRPRDTMGNYENRLSRHAARNVPGRGMSLGM